MMSWWNKYKYRFVPWLAMNIKQRSVRSVPHSGADKVIPEEQAIKTLHKYFWTLYHGRSPDITLDPAEPIALPRYHHINHRLSVAMAQEKYMNNMKFMNKILGFRVERGQSTISDAGTGVLVTQGTLVSGQIAALYPGSLYYPGDPILLQSIGNSFIFRCIDGLLIDGDDRGISKFIYKSCSNRDRLGPLYLSDSSWLTEFPLNPLAIGQYVNNHNKENPANVAYQELTLPTSFPIVLKQYVPNVFYHGMTDLDSELPQRCTRLVALVALRNVEVGEELFSSYFTMVH